MSNTSVTAKIANGGRVVIPAEYRRVLALKEGDEVILSLIDNEVRIVPRLQSLRHAQAIIARYAKDDDTAWADELIAERRADSRDE